MPPQLLTTNSPKLFACVQPPSQTLFILFNATSLFPDHSGLAPAPHCMADSKTSGFTGECQSHNQTVPKDPSPKHLSSVYTRSAPNYQSAKDEYSSAKKNSRGSSTPTRPSPSTSASIIRFPLSRLSTPPCPLTPCITPTFSVDRPS